MTARMLLLVALGSSALLAGCCEDPDNRAPYVKYEILEPPAGEVVGELDCSQAENAREFSLKDAVEDPDGDTLYVRWFVDGTRKGREAFDDMETMTLYCSEGWLGVGESSGWREVEAIVMDRPPLAEDKDDPDELHRRASSGGYEVRITWFIEVVQ